MKHTNVPLSVKAAMIARVALASASATNGLVSVKLHRIREQLDTKLGASLKTYDEIMQRFAKRGDDGTPVAIESGAYQLTGTRAYEPDPEKAAECAEALAPVLADTISLNVPLLSHADAEWVTGDNVGAGLTHFLAAE